MRFSITIPDEFYTKIKPTLDKEGYGSMNDYILSLIRLHQLGANGGKYVIQKEPEKNSDAPASPISIDPYQTAEDVAKIAAAIKLKNATTQANVEDGVSDNTYSPFSGYISPSAQIPNTQPAWGTRTFWCKFCQIKKPVEDRTYQYEDGSGEGTAPFCQKCWTDYEKKHNLQTIVPTSREINVGQANEFMGSLPKPVKKKK